MVNRLTYIRGGLALPLPDALDEADPSPRVQLHQQRDCRGNTLEVIVSDQLTGDAKELEHLRLVSVK